MSLRDLIESDASSVFCNTDDFAESITYVPKLYAEGDARANRTIKAVVVRQQLQVISEDVETVAPVFEVHVANSSTLGISSDELDLGGDALTFPPRIGETTATRTITQLLDHDEGMLVLECR